MARNIIVVAIALVGFAQIAYALPTFSSQQGLIPFANSTYYLGTTTPATLGWKGIVVDQVCLTADTCRTTWPSGSGGSGVWPFTTGQTNFGVGVQSTTTPEWFKNGLFASSTSQIAYASTTAVSATSLCLLGDSQCGTTITHSILDFGAKCDGTTDDAAAFTRATTWMSTANNRVIQIPAATCVTSQTITIGDGRQQNTILGAPLVGGETSITVASITGIVAGDNIVIQRDDGTSFSTAVSGTPAGTTVNLLAAFSGTASTGNPVYTGLISSYEGGGLVGFGGGATNAEVGGGVSVSKIKYTGSAAPTTSLNAAASAGDLTITVLSTASMTLGAPLGITLNNGRVWWTSVNYIKSSTQVALVNEIPSAASGGNAVTIASNPVVKVAGAIVGVHIGGVVLDANSLAAIGLDVQHPVRSNFRGNGGIEILNYTGIGAFIHSTRVYIGTAFGTADNDFELYAQKPANANTIGWWLLGSAGQANSLYNVAFSRNRFWGGDAVAGGNDVTAASIRTEYIDTNTFYKIFTENDGVHTSGASIYREPSHYRSGFPGANSWQQATIGGGTAAVTDGTDTGGAVVGKDFYDWFDMTDGASFPTNGYGWDDAGNLKNWNTLYALTSIGIGSTSPSTQLGVVGNGYFTGGLGLGFLNTTAGTIKTLDNSYPFSNGTTSPSFYSGFGTEVSNTIADFGINDTRIGGTQLSTQQGGFFRFDARPNQDVMQLYVRGAGGSAVDSLDISAASNVKIQNGGLSVGNAATPPTSGLLVTGNVGIGTTSPLATLGIQGSVGVNASQLYLAASGNVGVGTTSPWGGFSVVSNNTPVFVLATTTGASPLFKVSNAGTTTINNARAPFGNASPSPIFDVQMAGVSGMHYDTDGILKLTSQHNNVNPSIAFYQGVADATKDVEFADEGSGNMSINVTGVAGRTFGFTSNGLTTNSILVFGWSPGSDTRIAPDTAFSRLAAGKIGIGTGASGSVAGTLIAAKIGIATSTPSQALDINGVLTLEDGGSRSVPAGLVTEANSGLIEFGINDGSSSRFGPYVSASQGGFLRMDSRGGQDLFQMWGRTAADTSGSGNELLILNSSGQMALGMSPTSMLSIKGTRDVRGTNYQGIIDAYSTDALGANVGGGVLLGGVYTGSSVTEFGQLVGAKENATDGDYGGILGFYSRVNGGNLIERMRIGSTGNVGIGTTSPQWALNVTKTAAPQITIGNGTGENPWSFRSTGGALYLATSSAASFATSTVSALALDVNGSLYLNNYGDCSGATNALGITSGKVQCDSGVSDIRLKKKVTPFTDGLSVINRLSPVSFYWKDLSNHNTADPRKQYGFIAQDVAKIIPSAVDTSPDGYYTLDKTAIIPYLVAAVQQLQTVHVVVSTKRNIEEDWQWDLIGLLVLWNIWLTVRRRPRRTADDL